MFTWSLIIYPAIMTVMLVAVGPSQWRFTTSAGVISIIVGLATMNVNAGTIAFIVSFFVLEGVAIWSIRRKIKRVVAHNEPNVP